MAKVKRKKRSRSADMVERFVRPTEQREAHNDFRSAGAAYKKIPPIETLHNAGKLDDRQFLALGRYADVAHAAARSPVKSNIDFTIYGSGEGLPHFGVRMTLELDRLERALGALRDIARAICVDEMSASQWAMERSGSVMRERQAQGHKFIRWYEPPRMALRIALLEIEEAGNRLAREIGT